MDPQGSSRQDRPADVLDNPRREPKPAAPFLIRRNPITGSGPWNTYQPFLCVQDPVQTAPALADPLGQPDGAGRFSMRIALSGGRIRGHARAGNSRASNAIARHHGPADAGNPSSTKVRGRPAITLAQTAACLARLAWPDGAAFPTTEGMPNEVTMFSCPTQPATYHASESRRRTPSSNFGFPTTHGRLGDPWPRRAGRTRRRRTEDGRGPPQYAPPRKPEQPCWARSPAGVGVSQTRICLRFLPSTAPPAQLAAQSHPLTRSKSPRAHTALVAYQSGGPKAPSPRPAQGTGILCGPRMSVVVSAASQGIWTLETFLIEDLDSAPPAGCFDGYFPLTGLSRINAASAAAARWQGKSIVRPARRPGKRISQGPARTKDGGKQPVTSPLEPWIS